MKRTQKGFTLIELMIVIAIIGILAAIAVPQYQTYTNRARFSEVVAATGPYKTAAEVAVQTGRVTIVANLDAATAGIPANIADGNGANVGAVGIANGVITAAGQGNVAGSNYTLTAAINSGAVTWTQGGTCQAAGLC